MSAPFKMNPGRGPMQKTGKGIPDTFKSPTLQKLSYQQKLDASLKAIKDNDDSNKEQYTKKKQDNVLDSLNTVKTEGRKAAAVKYGNEARKKKTGKAGLPTDASEDTWITRNFVLDSKKSALNQKGKTYEQKLKESLAAIKSMDDSNDAAYLKDKQDNVLDSLKTVKTEGRKAAAKKYGDKARGKGLPTDASEDTWITRNFVLDSKK